MNKGFLDRNRINWFSWYKR